MSPYPAASSRSISLPSSLERTKVVAVSVVALFPGTSKALLLASNSMSKSEFPFGMGFSLCQDCAVPTLITTNAKNAK
ncbi:MAG TPA: hypothetical protein PKZ05_05830 [Bacteroidales bacterium]|nr:hypothetical protein [Bacteroidales bacterium]